MHINNDRVFRQVGTQAMLNNREYRVLSSEFHAAHTGHMGSVSGIKGAMYDMATKDLQVNKNFFELKKCGM